MAGVRQPLTWVVGSPSEGGLTLCTAESACAGVRFYAWNGSSCPWRVSDAIQHVCQALEFGDVAVPPDTKHNQLSKADTVCFNKDKKGQNL